MIRELFQRKRLEPRPTAASFAKDGFYACMTAKQLLATEQRQQLLERIWQYTALSQAQFAQLYLRPIHLYADYVQLLPASESHHHAYPGGMLDHGLELVACSLKLRQNHLLPAGAAPEDQSAQADAWTAGIAYGALLHDVGKVAVDLEVECQDGRRWHPWHGPLDQPYRFRYVKGRNYRLHGAAAGLLYARILEPTILDWLSGFPDLWGSLLYLLANQYEHAGLLGELVTQADRVSTAQNIGGNPSKALQAPIHSLQHHLLSGLRHLVKNEFKLNQPGAAGWLTDDTLWLVSKTTVDRLRAHLLTQSIDGVPSSNIAVFDELQSHGLVEATAEGKVIWTADVEDGSWRQRLTFLRLVPSLIWEPSDRPLPFSGTVTNALLAETTDVSTPSENGEDAQTFATESASTGTHALLDLLSDDLIDAHPTNNDQLEDSAEIDVSTFSAGETFIAWLRQGISEHSLIINDSRAKVHTVANTAFLVTPGIFQRYVAEHSDLVVPHEFTDAPWRWVQRQFEKLNVHRKTEGGLNIWICKVEGPRRKAELKGYLLTAPDLVFEENPPNNPFLRIVNRS